jgi:hypothetical protein
MSDVNDTRRREETGKRLATVIFLIALVVFGFVWFSR